MENITLALKKLDPTNDDHWTSDGAPRMDAVHAVAEDESITRKQVTDAWPEFNREVAAAQDVEEPKEGNAPEEKPSETEAEKPKEAEASQEGEKQASEEDPKEGEKQASETEHAEHRRVVQLDKVQEEYEALSEEIVELQAQVRALQEKLKVKNHQLTMLAPLVKTPGYDHREDQKARMDYIKSQTRNRAERAGSAAEVLSKLNLANVGKSPLDQAMARKTQRGTQRPQYPAPKSREA